MTCKIFDANIVTFDVYFYQMNKDFRIEFELNWIETTT